MKTLPPIGRPNKSGFSEKLLGHTVYIRLWRAAKPKLPHKRQWTGLQRKIIGHAAYMSEWRKLRTKPMLFKLRNHIT